MTEQPAPKRRISKRVRRTLAVVVLAPILYLMTDLALNFAWGVGLVPPPVVENLNNGFYAPFGWYIGAQYPGSRALLAMRNFAGDAGLEVGKRIPK